MIGGLEAGLTVLDTADLKCGGLTRSTPGRVGGYACAPANMILDPTSVSSGGSTPLFVSVGVTVCCCVLLLTLWLLQGGVGGLFA